MDLFKESSALKKPNSALVMVPKAGKLTAVARKIYNVLLHLTQQQINIFKKTGHVVEATYLFSAPLSKLLTPIFEGEDIQKTVAKQYLLEMRRTDVNWESPDASSGVIWSSMGLLSQVRLELKDGHTWVSWALPPDLLIAVSDPDLYTPLDTVYYGKLKSYASIALYEICSRYKNNPSGVTCKNATEWWSDALSGLPPKKDPHTGQPKYREWRKVKNEHVLDAIEEINEKTDLVIALNEFKERRAVVAVQFSVQKKQIKADKLAGQQQLSAEIAEQAARLDVPLKEVLKEVNAGYSEHEIRMALSQLEARTKRADLDAVKTHSGYFRRLLHSGDLPDAPAASPAPAAPAPTSAESAFAEQDGDGNASRLPLVPSVTADLALGAPSQAWRNKRRKEITEELIQLSPESQAVYVELAATSLSNAGILTANLARKLKLGDWKFGLLLSKVFEIYVLKNYGPDWDVEPKTASN